MNPRLRRLSSDYQSILLDFSHHRNIEVSAILGDPPEKYLVTYHLPGLTWNGRKNCPTSRDIHRIELYLGLDYPRIKPLATPKDEIFHPNIHDTVCIGDYWTAGETICDVIIKIGMMIQYADYNLKSPNNLAAARWAAQNTNRFPVGEIDLFPRDPKVELKEASGHSNKNAGTDNQKQRLEVLPDEK